MALGENESAIDSFCPNAAVKTSLRQVTIAPVNGTLGGAWLPRNAHLISLCSNIEVCFLQRRELPGAMNRQAPSTSEGRTLRNHSEPRP